MLEIKRRGSKSGGTPKKSRSRGAHGVRPGLPSNQRLSFGFNQYPLVQLFIHRTDDMIWTAFPPERQAVPIVAPSPQPLGGRDRTTFEANFVLNCPPCPPTATAARR